MLDGITNHKWEIGCYAPDKLYFAPWKMQQANIRDLQLIKIPEKDKSNAFEMGSVSVITAI